MTGANNINKPIDHRGNTYLHDLCTRGTTTVDQIRQALLMGADLHALNHQGVPPLGLALQHASPAVWHYLIEAGAEIFFKTKKGANFNAVLYAIACDNRTAFEHLINHGGMAHINQSGMGTDGRDEGFFALHMAIKHDRHQMINPLLRSGALVNAEAGPENLTPLHMAATQSTPELLQKLLRHGADINHRLSTTGMTPLHLAAQKDRLWTTDALIKMGADIHALDHKGQTALHIAAYHATVSVVRSLVVAGSDVNKRNATPEKETPLMQAARSCRQDVIKVLLDAGADALLTNAFNRSAFQLLPSHSSTYADNLLRRAEEKGVRKHFDKIWQARNKPKNKGPNGKEPKGGGPKAP